MTKQIVVLADAYEAMAQTTGHDHIIKYKTTTASEES